MFCRIRVLGLVHDVHGIEAHRPPTSRGRPGLGGSGNPGRVYVSSTGAGLIRVVTWQVYRRRSRAAIWTVAGRDAWQRADEQRARRVPPTVPSRVAAVDALVW